MKEANNILESLVAKPIELKKHNLPITRTGKRRAPKDILASGDLKIKDLFKIWPLLKQIPENLHNQLKRIAGMIFIKDEEDIRAYKKENKQVYLILITKKLKAFQMRA